MPVIQQRRSVQACLEKVACHQNVTKKNRWSLTWKLFVTVNIRLPDAICFFIMRIPGSSVTISSNATIKNGERQVVWQQLFSHFADFHDFQKWLPQLTVVPLLVKGFILRMRIDVMCVQSRKNHHPQQENDMKSAEGRRLKNYSPATSVDWDLQSWK